jgi:outer membrane protein assembly factor BamB
MDADRTTEFVFAKDANNGDDIWRFATGPTPSGNYGGPGPRVTPTVHDGRVFTVSAEGVLYALERDTGTEVWHRDLRADLGWRPPAEGTASTPVIDGDRLLLIVGGGDGETVGAFNRRTGKTLWLAGSDRTSYSSPMLWTVDGETLVLFLTGTKLSAFDPITGAHLWSYDWPTYDAVNVVTPLAVAPNRVFISSGYDQGAVVLRAGKAADRWTVAEVWRNRAMKNHFNNSIYHEGVLYGFDNAIFKAVDAETGRQLWRARGFGKGSLISAHGNLIVLSDDGELALVRPDREQLVVIHRAKALDGLTWTPPTVSGGRLYVRHQDEMACLEPSVSER